MSGGNGGDDDDWDTNDQDSIGPSEKISKGDADDIRNSLMNSLGATPASNTEKSSASDKNSANLPMQEELRNEIRNLRSLIDTLDQNLVRQVREQSVQIEQMLNARTTKGKSRAGFLDELSGKRVDTAKFTPKRKKSPAQSLKDTIMALKIELALNVQEPGKLREIINAQLKMMQTLGVAGYPQPKNTEKTDELDLGSKAATQKAEFVLGVDLSSAKSKLKTPPKRTQKQSFDMESKNSALVAKLNERRVSLKEEKFDKNDSDAGYESWEDDPQKEYYTQDNRKSIEEAILNINSGTKQQMLEELEMKNRALAVKVHDYSQSRSRDMSAYNSNTKEGISGNDAPKATEREYRVRAAMLSELPKIKQSDSENISDANLPDNRTSQNTNRSTDDIERHKAVLHELTKNDPQNQTLKAPAENKPSSQINSENPTTTNLDSVVAEFTRKVNLALIAASNALASAQEIDKLLIKGNKLIEGKARVQATPEDIRLSLQNAVLNKEETVNAIASLHEYTKENNKILKTQPKGLALAREIIKACNESIKAANKQATAAQARLTTKKFIDKAHDALDTVLEAKLAAEVAKERARIARQEEERQAAELAAAEAARAADAAREAARQADAAARAVAEKQAAERAAQVAAQQALANARNAAFTRGRRG